MLLLLQLAGGHAKKVRFARMSGAIYCCQDRHSCLAQCSDRQTDPHQQKPDVKIGHRMARYSAVETWMTHQFLPIVLHAVMSLWSAIGMILWSVYLSVRQSVCLCRSVFVAKRYILQQKWWNKWIGSALRGTRFITTFNPLHRPPLEPYTLTTKCKTYTANKPTAEICTSGIAWSPSCHGHTWRSTIGFPSNSWTMLLLCTPSAALGVNETIIIQGKSKTASHAPRLITSNTVTYWTRKLCHRRENHTMPL